MSRGFEPIVEHEGKLVVLRCPGPGLWRGAPSVGRVLRPGDSIGAIEVLGVLHAMFAPTGVFGEVCEVGGDATRARRIVDRRTRLLVIDPTRTANTAAAAPTRVCQSQAAGLWFRSPSAGRFFARPGPGKPAFVAEGDEIEAGRTVGLLEIMKTFTRIHYGGEGLPERARVKRVIPADEQDLAAGDPILELEP